MKGDDITPPLHSPKRAERKERELSPKEQESGEEVNDSDSGEFAIEEFPEFPENCNPQFSVSPSGEDGGTAERKSRFSAGEVNGKEVKKKKKSKKMFPCKHCGEQFTESYHLANHCKSLHNPKYNKFTKKTYREQQQELGIKIGKPKKHRKRVKHEKPKEKQHPFVAKEEEEDGSDTKEENGSGYDGKGSPKEESNSKKFKLDKPWFIGKSKLKDSIEAQFVNECDFRPLKKPKREKDPILVEGISKNVQDMLQEILSRTSCVDPNLILKLEGLKILKKAVEFSLITEQQYTQKQSEFLSSFCFS